MSVTGMILTNASPESINTVDIIDDLHFVCRPWTMETRADDDEAPTDPAARKLTHHDYTEQDFEGKYLLM